MITDWDFETGINAIDYTDIVQKKHLLPIELQAQKIEDYVQQIKASMSELIREEERLKDTQQKIRFRVVIFGVLSVLAMGASNFL